MTEAKDDRMVGLNDIEKSMEMTKDDQASPERTSLRRPNSSESHWAAFSSSFRDVGNYGTMENKLLPKDISGRHIKSVQRHGIKMAALCGIRDINNFHKKRYAEQRLAHIRNPLTQPSLASHCKTLDKDYSSHWYQRILLRCEKIDERISQLDENINETKLRLRDSYANVITSAIAFGVILTNGMLEDGGNVSTVVTNLSGVLLNILLAIKAIVEAEGDRAEQNNTLETLLEEYKNEMWEIDRYIGSETSSLYAERRDREIGEVNKESEFMEEMEKLMKVEAKNEKEEEETAREWRRKSGVVNPQSEFVEDLEKLKKDRDKLKREVEEQTKYLKENQQKDEDGGGNI